jgi:hypothetical protein
MSDNEDETTRLQAIRESETWVMKQAERLAEVMRDDPRNAKVPAYSLSVNALAVLLAGAWNLPCYRMLAERVQLEHRQAEHGGGRSNACEACGWFDGAAYKAVTGHEFIHDFPELFPGLNP